MENNSDKEMRNKLQNVEFPFDARAWEQMEAMLEEKRKPKGFIWWWFGGIAASLLIGAGMYGYHQFNNSTVNRNEVIAVNKSAAYAKDNDLKTKSATLISNSESSPASQRTTPPDSHRGPFTNANSFAKGDESAMTQNSGAFNSESSSTKKKNLKSSSPVQKATASPFSYANGSAKGEKEGAAKSNVNAAVNSQVVNETSIPIVNSNANAEVFEPIAMTAMKADALTGGKENLEELMKKKDGDEINLKKLNRKIFNYSVGVAANITGAFLGHQTAATGSNVFYNAPSYMAGLTHDFMFFKRFAISNSVLFSQTSYKVYNAKSTYPEGLKDYTSKVTEIAIPIGIKGYAVTKPKFRFYIAAGIINHIKLKETFAYTYNYYTPYVNAANNVQLPNQTQFNTGGKTPLNGITSANQGYYRSASTSDFALNHAKRYYASFYASAGAEFIVQKHCVFFAEPLFYMSLEKVGVQDKYKYNVGLSGGIRYQF